MPRIIAQLLLSTHVINVSHTGTCSPWKVKKDLHYKVTKALLTTAQATVAIDQQTTTTTIHRLDGIRSALAEVKSCNISPDSLFAQCHELSEVYV